MFEVWSPAEARAFAGLPGITEDLPWSDEEMAERQLASLAGLAGTYLEIRTLGGGRAMQEWHPSANSAVDAAMRMKEQRDVYVGVQPRARKGGGKDALAAECWWMWVEADTQHAAMRALDYTIPPRMVVRSSPGKAHCYWPLTIPLRTDDLERGNKRLAWELGGDMNATDAARILRVAGTRNHKYGQAHRVAMVQFTDAPPVDPRDLVGALADPSPPKPLPVVRPGRAADASMDELRDIPARVYVEALCEREVRQGMVRCPFHSGGEERTPSLHVSGDPALWYCFGCSEGGDIFTFAGRLWGLDTVDDFPEIKKRLVEMRL